MGNRMKWQSTLLLFALLLILSSCSVLERYTGAAEPDVEVERTSAIAGRIWHDVCGSPAEGVEPPLAAPEGCVYLDAQSGFRGDGVLMAEEPGIQGVEVTLGEGPCPAIGLVTTTTASDGLYLFAGLAEGTYCVRIDPVSDINASVLLPGSWTYPSDSDVAMEVSIVLGADEIRSDVYFGWDYEFLPPYEAPIVTPTEIPTITPTPESEPIPAETATATPQASPTPDTEDPSVLLGDPDWVDTFDGGTYWPVYSDDHVSFSIENEQLRMTAYNPDYWNGWVLPSGRVGNVYLEMTADQPACSGRDSFGVVLRASHIDIGQQGYLFGISCDGRYSLRQWDGESLTKLVDWTATSELEPGGEESYRLGIMADGERFTLYVNGVMVHEITDSAYAEGMFGVFVSSAATPNFTVEVSQMAYWLLP